MKVFVISKDMARQFAFDIFDQLLQDIQEIEGAKVDMVVESEESTKLRKSA